MCAGVAVGVFLQSDLQRKNESPPEVALLASLAMSGRLDSNQRPPEPHIGWRISKRAFFRAFLRIGHSTLPIFYRGFCPIPQKLLPLLPWLHHKAAMASEAFSREAAYPAVGTTGVLAQ
jgi:hypothetical protein